MTTNDKTITLDMSELYNDKVFHEHVKKVFGFPDFYGNNYHAFIDCLSSLRFPEDGMTEVIINTDEVLADISQPQIIK